MKHARIRYFTGTGNTARACELVAAELRAAGHDVELSEVRRGVADGGCEARLHVFAFPIYACGVPHIMREYLVSLPRTQAANAAVICTMGDEIVVHNDGRRSHIPGFEGHALAEAAGILRRRGYDVLFTDTCSYPLNWTQVVNAPKPDICDELQAQGDAQATSIGKRIAAGERSIRRFGRAHLLWTLPFDRLYALVGRRRMARLFVSDANCNSCGLCARTCPAQAIRLIAGRPRWTMKCAGCQRCINTCPQSAIQTSWLRVIAELVLMLLPLLPLILRLANGHRATLFGVSLSPGLEILLWTAAYVLCYVIADNLLLALEFVPGLGTLVQWNFTRRFRRYAEPHFRPSKE